MTPYRYVKSKTKNHTLPWLPAVAVVFGLMLLIWVAYPILSFEFFYDKSVGYTVSPLAPDFMVHAQTQEKNSQDLTKLHNWFGVNNDNSNETLVTVYKLSIPKVKINQALVQIGSDDLSKSLIHFKTGGLPGKYGNTVIFGHSVLPQFYNPKNYLTIFSLLPELKIGDDIYVHFDGIDYRYKVISKIVTEPDDITGLEQRFDSSYLTLVTCVPPGTYFKRLWVQAKQTSFDSPKSL